MSNSVSYYPWVIGFSMFFGILWSWLNANTISNKVSYKAKNADQDRSLILSVLALTGAFIGSRIAYLIIHFNAYLLYPETLIKNLASGLDWIGAPIGAAIFLLPVFIKSKRSILMDLGLLTPLWTSVCFGCWYAVNFVPVYYSGPVNPAGWSIPMPGILGDIEQRLPIAAIGVIWTILADLLSYRAQGMDLPSGTRLFAVILYQMIFCLIMSFVRIDSVPKIGGMPLDRVFSLIYLIACGITLMLIQRFSTVRRTRLQRIGSKPAGR